MPGWIGDHATGDLHGLSILSVGLRFLHYQDDIGLTSQQLSQMLSRLKEYRQDLYQARKDLLEKAGEIAVALHGPTIDVQAAYRLVDEYSALMNTADRLLVDVAADVIGMLSPQQYSAAEQIYNTEKAIFPPLPFGATHSS